MPLLALMQLESTRFKSSGEKLLQVTFKTCRAHGLDVTFGGPARKEFLRNTFSVWAHKRLPLTSATASAQATR